MPVADVNVDVLLLSVTGLTSLSWFQPGTDDVTLSLSVRRVSKRYGFKEVVDEEDWNLYWTDYSVTLERVMDMKKYQVLCRFCCLFAQFKVSPKRL